MVNLGSEEHMKKLIINIVVIFLILLGGEYYLYKKNNDILPFIALVKSPLAAGPFSERYDIIKRNGFYEYSNAQSDDKFRRPVYGNKDLKPIVLFGCSFAWGARLYESQTFHYKLSKLLNQTVYNRAISGWGVQHMLYQLRNEELYKEIEPPEYIIYLYISNHIKRMYKYAYLSGDSSRVGDYNFLKYNKVFDKLVEEHRVWHIPYSRLWNEVILYSIAKAKENNHKYTFKLLEKHLLESKKEAERQWGKGIKFVIFDYESGFDNFNSNKGILNKENVAKLEADGFIVIQSSQLTNETLGDKYCLDENDQHPNEAAWNLLTPLFVKTLKEIT